LQKRPRRGLHTLSWCRPHTGVTPERQRRSALGELETFDLGWVELGAVRWVEHGELAVDEAVECDAAIADVRDRVDLKAGGVAERRVVHPAARHRRIHLAEPDEVDGEGVVIADVDVRDLAAIEIALADVLDLGLPALEAIKNFLSQLHSFVSSVLEGLQYLRYLILYHKSNNYQWKYVKHKEFLSSRFPGIILPNE
jgi:hypothetical protein